jgi:hypothetical protein
MTDLRKLIHEMLGRSEEADPHVIAKRLVTRIPQEDLREALASSLADTVRIEIGRLRMQAFNRPAPTSVHAGSSEEASGRVGKSRWERHAEVLLNQRIFVDGDWKILRDCTADDLEKVADGHADRAREAEAVAARFRGFAAKVRAAGVATMGELDKRIIEGLAA